MKKQSAEGNQTGQTPGTSTTSRDERRKGTVVANQAGASLQTEGKMPAPKT